MKTFILSVILVVFSCPPFVKAQQNSYLVKDIKRGKLGSNPNNLISSGGLLYFVAEDGVHGNQIWKSDGTENGTQIVRILPNKTISNLIDVQGKVFFVLQNFSGIFLWKTDGTYDGTALVTKLQSMPGPYFNVNGILLFLTSNANTRFLWRSDGTAEGTYYLKSANEDDKIRFTNFFHIDGTLYFSLADNYGDAAADLWKTNGTIESTKLLKSGINKISKMRDGGNVLYFISTIFQNNTYSSSLWQSDGTIEGTKVINIDIPATGLDELVKFDEHDFYFSAGNQLWKTNIKQEKAIKICETRSKCYGLKLIGNRLYFVGDNDESEGELWTSDGTPEGSQQVLDIYYNYSSSASPLLDVDGYLLFISRHPTLFMHEIWLTNGTAGGTRKIDSSGNLFSGIAQVGNLLYYTTEDQNSSFFGSELWVLEIDKISNVIENPVSSNSLKIYPNPFKNSATISVQGNIMPGTEYVLFDVLGREVRRFKTELSHFTFDRSSLNAGMYTLQLSNKSGMIHQRLVIVN